MSQTQSLSNMLADKVDEAGTPGGLRPVLCAHCHKRLGPGDSWVTRGRRYWASLCPRCTWRDVSARHARRIAEIGPVDAPGLTAKEREDRAAKLQRLAIDVEAIRVRLRTRTEANDKAAPAPSNRPVEASTSSATGRVELTDEDRERRKQEQLARAREFAEREERQGLG